MNQIQNLRIVGPLLKWPLHDWNGFPFPPTQKNKHFKTKLDMMASICGIKLWSLGEKHLCSFKKPVTEESFSIMPHKQVKVR